MDMNKSTGVEKGVIAVICGVVAVIVSGVGFTIWLGIQIFNSPIVQEFLGY